MYISEISNEMPKKFNSELEEKIFKKLKELNIEFEVVDNDPADTMEDCIEIDKVLGEPICKTVVVCNEKKTNYYLVEMPADKRFDTKAFRDALEISRVSFVRVDDLKEKLGVVPGSASALCIVHDTDCIINVVIDKEIADREYISCNASDSRRHVKIKTRDLEKFLKETNHPARIVEL